MLSFAREHAWQPRGGSNVHTFIPVLLERLEAENAQLRGSVVELALQIQALRDDSAIRSPKLNPIGVIGLRAADDELV